MKRDSIVLFTATILAGLTAGLFYSWSFSITVGLTPLPDKEYITTFQSLNRQIQTPVFFTVFFGPVILLPASAWLQRRYRLKFRLLLASFIVYIAGVMLVTILGNVPMNEALDAFKAAAATTSEIADKRLGFEAKWNNLNYIRTFSSLVSFVLTVLTCLSYRQEPSAPIK